MPDILFERSPDGIAVLTLNRPDALNSFSFAMYEELIAVLEGLRHDAQTRVVILTGAGRAFCAGHDLRSGGSAPWVEANLGKPYLNKHSITRIAQIPLLMRSIPQPVIAAVNGAAAGLGFAFALAADMCLAARSAKFVNSIHNAGTGHELGMSWMLPRAVGTQRAAEILLTARPVLADEAERIGLALRAVDDDKLLAEARALAESMCANVPLGVWLTKQSLWLNQGVASLEAACEIEARAVFIAQSSEDAAEKRKAFVEKRPPAFRNR
ncbi:enoyl-CoA hydratase/isomerase family protein [Ideonella sp. B508-1]|uniref:enoyl-CoA hydratase/isomerase family protein n=1 Tax=Ideonella sp. B508-1 TaxID=137716 RepID=UPI0003493CEF|nr:enoyl-CoA hydratase-related protein [Ideonella sp. B508-1]